MITRLAHALMLSSALFIFADGLAANANLDRELRLPRSRAAT